MAGRGRWWVAGAVVLSSVVAGPVAADDRGAPAGASSGWTEPRQVGPSSGAPEVTVDAHGGGLVVWTDDVRARLLVRRIHRNGDLGPTGVLRRTGQQMMNFVVTQAISSGGAMASWTRSVSNGSVLETRRVGPGGVGGSVRTMATGSVVGHSIATEPSGRTVAVWRRNTGLGMSVHARVRRGDYLGPTHDVAAIADIRLSGVAIGPGGHAVIWWVDAADGGYRTWARRLSPTGALGPRTLVSLPGRSGSVPSSEPVAIDRQGDARFLVSDSTGPYTSRLLERRWPHGRALQSPRQLAASAKIARIEMTPEGRAVIAWQEADGGWLRIRAATIATSGQLAWRKWLAAAGTHSSDVFVRIDSHGRALVTWLRDEFSGGGMPVVSRVVSPSGQLGATHVAGGATWVDSDVGPNGAAVMAWKNADMPTFVSRRRIG